MIDLSKLEGFSSFKVVDASMVAQSSGWVVVAVIEREQFRYPERPGSYSYDHDRNLSVEIPRYDEKHAHPHVVQSPAFLLGKRRDDELEELQKRAVDIAREHDHAAKRWVDIEHKLRTVEKERDELRSDLETLGAQYKRALQAELDLTNKARRIEEDLAKVRREVGEKEWKRITAPRNDA